MSKFLIEVPHEADPVACTRAIHVFLNTGSHFLAESSRAKSANSPFVNGRCRTKQPFAELGAERVALASGASTDCVLPIRGEVTLAD